MLNESETRQNRNIFIRTIENNNLLKWSGALVAGLSLLVLLVDGSSLSVSQEARTVAIGIVGVAAAALGEANNH